MFLIFSLIYTSLIIIVAHYCDGKNGTPPLSWTEIYDDRIAILFFALSGAILSTIVVAIQNRDKSK